MCADGSSSITLWSSKREINAAFGSLVHSFPAGKSVLPHLAMVAFASAKDARDLLAQLSPGTSSDRVKDFKQATLRVQMSAFGEDAYQLAGPELVYLFKPMTLIQITLMRSTQALVFFASCTGCSPKSEIWSFGTPCLVVN